MNGALVCRTSHTCKNVSPLTDALRRVAVPVKKLPYDPERHVAPGKHAPDPNSFNATTGRYTKPTKDDFTTYDVYTFRVYEYDTCQYHDYWEACEAGCYKEIKEEGVPFELSFDVQKWQKVSGGRLVLNPSILQSQPREVAMVPLKGIGIEREEGFGIVLRSLEKKTGRVLRVLIYWNGKYPNPNIAVHRWGPKESKGCATTPDPKYAGNEGKWGHAGLAAFETDMMKWMNLDPGTGRDARILLPGTASDPPYLPDIYMLNDMY